MEKELNKYFPPDKIRQSDYEPFPIEPGIVRNEYGRIVQTGWPYISPKMWPVAHTELVSTIRAQQEYEAELLVTRADAVSPLRKDGAVFLLRDTLVKDFIRAAVGLKMVEGTHAKREVAICDIGGGDGTLLRLARKVVDPNALWQNPYYKKIKTTLTTLTDFGIAKENKDAVDRVVITSAELPPDDFYETFDIITAQNSIYYWSKFPELATRNVVKMLKPGGIFIASLPEPSLPVQNQAWFPMISAPLQERSLKLLDSEREVTRYGEGWHIFACEKIPNLTNREYSPQS